MMTGYQIKLKLIQMNLYLLKTPEQILWNGILIKMGLMMVKKF